MPTLQFLRHHAISQSLFQPTTLNSAINRVGFVQADPIRSPARAQDLILRHRVKNYHAGDLERRYAELNIEEDVLYAHGFLPRQIWQLLHPRNVTDLSAMGKKVLETVCKVGRVHPKDLETIFGRERMLNAWGGYSKATTRILEDLHHRGLLRIAGRENGIRIYEPANNGNGKAAEFPAPAVRLRKLILVVANLLAPVPLKTLTATMSRYRRLGNPREALENLLRTGELEQQAVDGLQYIWAPIKQVGQPAPPIVRFLAPFDPLVWDRRRFEHLWGWPYRFEAYTPAAKRVRGYYALPLLWGEDIIGWANARLIDARLNVEIGFVNSRPREKLFRAELEAEVRRMEMFLGVVNSVS